LFGGAARALDLYFQQRVKIVDHKETVEIDPRLVTVVERMITRYAGICCPPQQALPDS
jgi:hypothetical protein